MNRNFGSASLISGFDKTINPFVGVICPGFYMGVVLSQSATIALWCMVCVHKCSLTPHVYA